MDENELVVKLAPEAAGCLLRLLSVRRLASRSPAQILHCIYSSRSLPDCASISVVSGGVSNNKSWHAHMTGMSMVHCLGCEIAAVQACQFLCKQACQRVRIKAHPQQDLSIYAGNHQGMPCTTGLSGLNHNYAQRHMCVTAQSTCS